MSNEQRTTVDGLMEVLEEVFNEAADNGNSKTWIDGKYTEAKQYATRLATQAQVPDRGLSPTRRCDHCFFEVLDHAWRCQPAHCLAARITAKLDKAIPEGLASEPQIDTSLMTPEGRAKYEAAPKGRAPYELSAVEVKALDRALAKSVKFVDEPLSDGGEELRAAAEVLAALRAAELAMRESGLVCDGTYKEVCQVLARSTKAAPTKTCSDERPCIPCYLDQGDCLGPAKAAPAGSVEKLTDEQCDAIVKALFSQLHRTNYPISERRSDIRAAIAADRNLTPRSGG